MQNCQKCNVSVFKKPLSRINPVGEDGIWWCDDCIKTHEPELFKNEEEDRSQIEKDLRDMFY